jgi:hypothetical protein
MGRYGSTTRRPVEEVVSLDRYGNRAFRCRELSKTCEQAYPVNMTILAAGWRI